MSDTVKRARCSNFSLSEEEALAVKNASILECKKSDHNVWASKAKAWEQIQVEFISATGSQREIQNFKDKYENLKRKTKKIEEDLKKDIFQTGDGSNSRSTVSPSATHSALLGSLGVSAVGLNNPFDGDQPGKPLIPSINEVKKKNSGGRIKLILKSKKSAELTSLLSTKKKKTTTIRENIKEMKAQEKLDAEEIRSQERHNLEKIHLELLIEKLKLEVNEMRKRSKEW